ncbi:type II secretion system F family protein [Xylanimonas ulmi]|uniref:Tight adherence protein C n=1 Tax=Xylanimonas ulmi TaxID=228973 RepID=A0A4Q7M523_9MICO|nr:type II secretion system F family protein [Xylanibacterium ulmi]RZS63085.1 tight adherence protein C [Xylanibacterium ulmi]
MIALGVAAAAALLLLVAVQGVRLMTSTGLETVEEQYRPAPTSRRAKGFVGLIDALGERAVGTAVRAYGAQRLRRLDVAIRRAGRPDGVTVTVYVRRQAGFAVLSVILLALFALLGQPLVGVPIAVVLTSWMPLWLHATGRTRQQEIDRELPDFLDVLGVTVTAGLGFRQALERVCEFHDGALAEEMRRALQEMAVGVSRREALVGLRERSRSEAIASLVTALLQAEELGVPLVEALAAIAKDVRRERAAAARQAAARAAPKVSLVVTLTILPGALLLIVASVLIANAEVLGGIF